jgi:hypothetical protein
MYGCNDIQNQYFSAHIITAVDIFMTLSSCVSNMSVYSFVLVKNQAPQLGFDEC